MTSQGIGREVESGIFGVAQLLDPHIGIEIPERSQRRAETKMVSMPLRREASVAVRGHAVFMDGIAETSGVFVENMAMADSLRRTLYSSG